MSRLLGLAKKFRCNSSYSSSISEKFRRNFSSSSSISDLFDDWCKEYGKTYASEEEKQQRLKLFEHNYEIVVEHNKRAISNSSHRLSLNAFADLSNHEFKSKHVGFLPLIEESDLPASVDWRKKGAVTAVKDQGSCDSGEGSSILEDV